MKLLVLAVVFLIVGGAIYDMPRPCFSARLFGTCARVQYTALSSGFVTDWSTVGVIRPLLGR